MAIQGGLHITI